MTEEKWLKLLPSTSSSVTVSFYHDSPDKLAEKHEVVKALLTVVPKARQGSFKAPLAALCNIMDQPPFRVIKAFQVHFLAKYLLFDSLLKR